MESAHETDSKEIGPSDLRRLSACNKSRYGADVEVGYSGIFYKLVGRKSAPKRNGSAAILYIDDTGVTVKLPAQTRGTDGCGRSRTDSNPGSGDDDGAEIWPPLVPERGSAKGSAPLITKGGRPGVSGPSAHRATWRW